MGLAGQAAALDRCSHDPAVARPWLVDDPSHAATRAARQLRGALRAWLRPARHSYPSFVVAVFQSGAGTACRAQVMGEHECAPRAFSPLLFYACRLADRVARGHDSPLPHDQGCIRTQCATPFDNGGSVGAPMDRGDPHGSCLCSWCGRGHPRDGCASPPSREAQRCAAADDMGDGRLTLSLLLRIPPVLSKPDPIPVSLMHAADSVTPSPRSWARRHLRNGMLTPYDVSSKFRGPSPASPPATP